MIGRMLSAAVAAFMVGGLAKAEQVSVAPVAFSGLEGFSAISGNFSPMIKHAGYYCRRDCTWCRNDCYYAYRIDCYGAGCRQSFVLCMRACWNNICRHC